ncbi:MAG: HD domain-containing protein, partial [Gaiellaceae bacterium]
MAVLETHEQHQELIDELIADVAAYNPDVDRELIRRAFLFAADAHEGQQRRSGEEFVLHPWGAAKICAQLQLDDETIAAALLHDVVEDTEVDLDDVRAEFGDEIAKLVEGVTKLTRVQFQSREQAEAENYRKLIIAMAEDVRVILIKLADRLHNMRTLDFMPPEARRRTAEETLDIYAPLAGRMGMHELREELENLAFHELNPDAYRVISERLAALAARNQTVVSEIERQLTKKLADRGIVAKVKGRHKRPYSTWRK